MSWSGVAATPRSWGAFALGVDAADPDTVLDEMAAAGFDGTELGELGFFPDKSVPLKAAVQPRGLTVISAAVPVTLADVSSHDEALGRALRVARIVTRVKPDAFIVLTDTSSASRSLDSATWSTVARGAERIARELRDITGLHTVFRNHAEGLVASPEDVAILLARTSAELVGLCLDTAHYVLARGDLLDVVSRFGSRIWLTQLRDLDLARARRPGATRSSAYCELGQGSVPLAALLDALEKARYDSWLVVDGEPTFDGDPAFDRARRGRELLRALGV